MLTVQNFSGGLLSPVLGYIVSCLGAFLGLRCITRASYYRQTRSRVRWLAAGAMAIGATGIWAMYLIAMLGFAIPGQRITYNVPITIASLLIVVVVVGAGVFTVGFGNGSPRRLLAGGLIVGSGILAMHYLGMTAMIMRNSVSYRLPLLVLSVVIAVVAGTAALWIGTSSRGIGATAAASLVMGLAVSGMHYTAMAAMRFNPGAMPAMPGMSAESFLLPMVVAITLATFVLAVIINVSPTEGELRDDADFLSRLELMERSHR
jgi:NO-binding membrane sensor protein with MHYT domain